MSKKLVVVLLILSLLSISGCTNSRLGSSESNIEVRGLSLKISLITVAYDVYRTNFKNTTEFNEELYKNCGDYGLKYYKWLKDTYSTMDSSMKRRLIRIFDNYASWTYVSETISLDDNVSVEKIVDKLNNQSNLELNEMRKEDIDVFFNYFYKEYLKDFIEKNNLKIKKNSKKINAYLERKNIDIFKFMEDTSGIKFEKDYKAVFYYDLPPIGSMGFEDGNYNISTINSSANKDNLFCAPFHEYSHDIFGNFTRHSDFTKIANKLRKDKNLSSSYERIGKDAYDWVGWCEENLVEGFAKYLEYKYYDNKSTDASYVYDIKFYNYLIDNNFNPENTGLKEISIQFYEDILNENL